MLGLVLLLFRPALLFRESPTTSLREIRSNLRVIVLSSTVLVIATAVGALSRLNPKGDKRPAGSRGAS